MFYKLLITAVSVVIVAWLTFCAYALFLSVREPRFSANVLSLLSSHRAQFLTAAGLNLLSVPLFALSAFLMKNTSLSNGYLIIATFLGQMMISVGRLDCLPEKLEKSFAATYVTSIVIGIAAVAILIVVILDSKTKKAETSLNSEETA